MNNYLAPLVTFLHLPIDSNNYPALICTSELCKEGTIKFQLYCINQRSQPFQARGPLRKFLFFSRTTTEHCTPNFIFNCNISIFPELILWLFGDLCVKYKKNYK